LGTDPDNEKKKADTRNGPEEEREALGMKNNRASKTTAVLVNFQEGTKSNPGEKKKGMGNGSSSKEGKKRGT